VYVTPVLVDSKTTRPRLSVRFESLRLRLHPPDLRIRKRWNAKVSRFGGCNFLPLILAHERGEMRVYRIESLADGKGPFTSASTKDLCGEPLPGAKPLPDVWRARIADMKGWVETPAFHDFATIMEGKWPIAWLSSARAGFPSWDELVRWSDGIYEALRRRGFVVAIYEVDNAYARTAACQVVFDATKATRTGFVPLPIPATLEIGY
jgi:hypothetical protein